MLLGFTAVEAMAQLDEPLPAIHAPLADKSLVLDVIHTGQRFVAVGERGHVLLSEDGDSWRQARHVPIQSTLTRVTRAGEMLWAVGHGATIIRSDDGGETWALQHYEPGWERPLLDVYFFNPDEGIAAGAYGLFMRTNDGGAEWQVEEIAELVTGEAIEWPESPGDDWLDEDEDFYDAALDFDRGCYETMECHLNAVLDLGDGRLMIAAERGYGYRSTDGGETWESFRFPYPGSMFGLLPSGGCIIAFGLRGNVQRSCDFGDEWHRLDAGTESTLMGGTAGAEGTLIMVGAGATVLRLAPDGSFMLTGDRLGSDYAAVAVDQAGRLILGGEDGLRRGDGS